MTLSGIVRALALSAGLALSACTGALDGLDPGRAEQPMPQALQARMSAKGMSAADPMMIRIFKEEDKLEVWKRTKSGRYALLKAYDICKYSGKLGPKFKEGDRQAPEGFYLVNKNRLNPNSKYYLSINMGFPNPYDRSHGRTGSHLMIHGACSSAGCYSMTDPSALEIYALARDAFRGGQSEIQIQAFPFRMTPKNLARHADSEHFDYWRMLKKGYDLFQITKRPPDVKACGRQYVFGMEGVGDTAVRFRADQACPPMGMRETMAREFMARHKRDERKLESLLAKKENREPRDLSDLTFASTFPGAQIIIAERPVLPKVVDEKAVREASEKIEQAGPTLDDVPEVIVTPEG